MAEVIETAFVEVRPDTRGFAQETRRQVSRSVGRQRDLVPNIGIRGPVLRGLLSAGTQLTAITGGVAAGVLAIKTGFDEISESQQVLAQTNAVLKSTGGVANVTADQVQVLAGSLSDLSGIDDELIQKGENLLLTFKNVRNEIGAGNAIFDRATKSAIDLSVAGFGSIESTSKQLGKALNDPVRGMTALGRAGVTFTQSQKDTIKALVESGDLLSAQRLLLDEVESQVGGSAEAFGTTLPGAIGRLKNSFSELMAEGLTPLIPGLTAGVTFLADFFREMRAGNGASSDVAQGFQAVKNAVTPLFDAIADEGPRIRGIFDDLRDIVRDNLPLLKLLGTIIGITLVAAFKVSIRIMENFVAIWKFTAAVIREAIQVIISVIDGFLGGLAAAADAASHIPFIGDKFDGVADSINAAREDLRGFSEELDGQDGRQVDIAVNVTLNRREEGGTGHAGVGGVTLDSVLGRREEGALGHVEAPVVTPPKRERRQVEVGPRELRERRLQEEAEIARLTQETLADDREALQRLIAFYDESAEIARARGQSGRKFVAASLQIQNELRAINQQAADASRQAAEDARQAAADRAEAALEERRATLEANIRIAEASEGNVKDDIAAYKKLIGFLQERVAAAREAGAGLREAQAELKQAQRDLVTIQREVRQAQLDEREELLRDRVTLAGFTETEKDDERATKALILFFRKRIRDMSLTAKERRKYRIELEQAKQDLRDIRADEKDALDTAGKRQGTTAFELLQQNVGRFGDIAGNLIDANQPFKEASDFVASQAELLTRRPGAASVVVEQKSRRDRQIDELIAALDRNTVATEGGTPGRGRTGAEHGRGSGATPRRDNRWTEAGQARAKVELY